MTRKQFIKKVNELIASNNRLIKESAQKVLNSGCMDLESAENDYALPKAFIHAALLSSAEQWKPLSKEVIKEASNMCHFI